MSDPSAPRGWFQLSLKTILLVMAGIGIFLAARFPHQPAQVPTKLLSTALHVGDRLACYPSTNHGGWRLELSKSGSYEVIAIGDDFVQVESRTRQRFIPLAMITSIDNAKPPSSAASSTANAATASGNVVSAENLSTPFGAITAAGDSPNFNVARALIDKYDKDRDGALSKEESARTRSAAMLEQADANADGKISAEELGAHLQARSRRSLRGP